MFIYINILVICGVRDKSLPTQDRAGLLQDCLALTRAKLLDPVQLMRLLASYKNEDDCTVWDAISSVLVSFDKVLLSNQELSDTYRKFSALMIEPLANKLGWDAKENDCHQTKMLRQTLIGLLARFSKNPDVVAEARSRFEAVLADPSDVKTCPSDYRTSVYALVLKTGGRKEYEQLLKLYEELDNNADRKQVLGAIGRGSTVELKRAALDWATSGAVKLQDFFYPISSGTPFFSP